MLSHWRSTTVSLETYPYILLDCTYIHILKKNLRNNYLDFLWFMKQAWNILWLLVTNENIGRWKNEARRQTVLIFLSFLPCFTCQVVTFLLLTELRFRKGLDKLKLAILYHCKSDLVLLYYYPEPDCSKLGQDNPGLVWNWFQIWKL